MRVILHTERLLLREITSQDAEVMYEMNQDPIIEKFTGDKPFPSVQATSEFIEKYTDYRVHGFGRWAVVLKDTHEVLGWCGLKQNPDLVDLGYRLLEKHRRLGYATEAASACIKYGFNELNINEIIARAHKNNVASIGVMNKIGMKYWKEILVDNVETVYYKLNKDSK